MASIDAASRLAAIIQAQYRASHPTRPPTARAKRPATEQPAVVDASDSGEGSGVATDLARLQQAIVLQTQALSAEDPQRPRKAFRLFLESVLTQTFGRDRLDERDLARLADSVLERMESDSQLQTQMHEAGELLLAAVADRPPTPAKR